MIYDTIENLKKYRNLAPLAWDQVCRHLPDFSTSSPSGKTVLIENKLFIIIQRYNTHALTGSNFEIHREFADIQLLLDGKETVAYTDIRPLQCVSPYHADSDFALYAAAPEIPDRCTLIPGNFVIFFPGEGHMPSCGDGDPVTKAVIKIHKSLLD
ncbi:MAG: DUF386 domain-containing protein [Lentisphaerae bacterium]|nr:DUF386 domain-containing protein [Lentisphaerota bacterium]